MLTGLLAKGVGFIAMGACLSIGFYCGNRLIKHTELFVERHSKAAKEAEQELVQELLKQQQEAQVA